MVKNNKINKQKVTLLQVFDEDNKHFLMRVGKDRSKHSYDIMVRARTYVAEFLQSWEKCQDVPLESLQLDFIQRFSVFLSVEKTLRGGTIWLNCMMLKGVVQRAHRRGLIRVSPFAEFHIAKNIREREFLDVEEILQLYEHDFSHPLEKYVRDVFVFSAFTGMSFVDIRHLRKSDIQEIDGHQWIMSSRHKTGIPFRVRLLDQPLSIICQYEKGNNEYIFDRLEYHAIAKRLPAILKACNINKHITLHCARHSFAVMALNYGVPIESVSRILGHSNITTTQIYAKITTKKLNMDFLRLEHGIDTINPPTRKKGSYLIYIKKGIRRMLSFLHLTTKERGGNVKNEGKNKEKCKKVSKKTKKK